MSTDFDSFSNRGEYLSAHYFAEQLADGLKKGVFAAWADRESDENDDSTTPRVALRGLRSVYLDEKYRGFFAEQAQADAQDDEYPDNEGFEERLNTYQDEEWRERLADWHRQVLTALGYPEADLASGARELTVHRAGRDHTVHVAWHGDDIVAVDCGWSASNDNALDTDAYGNLLHPVRTVGTGETVASGHALATWLFQSEVGGEGGRTPRFVLLLCGGVIVLADRHAWGEGRYLAANLDAALERYDRKQFGELATIAGLFSHDALAPAEDGKGPAIDALVKASRDNAVGVSGELRQGLQKSVEIIANEVLARLEEAGLQPRDLETPGDPFARQLTREALRYLYRVLFLLYAESRPELGILPADDGTYEAGYSVARLRDLVERDVQLTDETARNGFHLHSSLDVLFNNVNRGHRPYGTEEWDEQRGDDAETRKAKAKRRSEGRGLRFEALRSELFEPASVRLIGLGMRDPRRDDDHPEGPAWLDLRLRNSALHEVLRLLTMKKAKRRGERGGFISYRNLGINQLGAVYEGLMSYTGILAGEELCEVAKGGDPEKGSWLVPSHRLKEYPEKTWVEYDERDREQRGLRGPKKYPAGSFVYRLAGRERETSASYYTPESLTKVTVELALKHRLDQEKDEAGDVIKTRASELLKYRICEPALGSGAFLNEAINKVAEEYLRRRQDELGTAIPTAQALTEKQKVKAYIALHNSYGVDLNETGVELAEVSLWLNTMHPGMRAPWFGLHLRRGNSLIGGRRAVYAAEDVAPVKGRPGWLNNSGTQAPTPLPFRNNEEGGAWQPLPDGAVHQFLLPTPGWAAVTGASGDAKKLLAQLASDGVEQLRDWKKGVLRKPERKFTKAGTPRVDTKTGGEAASQYTRLRDAARRAEFLWELVAKRMELSEREIARSIDVWGASPERDEEFAFLRRGVAARGETRLSKEKVYADLFDAVDTPYWRLKQVMNAWCALWFWPVDKVGLLDGTDEEYTAQSVDVEELLGGFGAAETRPEVPQQRAQPIAAPPEASGRSPRFVEAGLLFQMDGDQPTFDDAEMDAEGDYFYEMQKAGGAKGGKKGNGPAPKRRRPVIPLKDLDDWLDFLESMLGTGPVPEGGLGSALDSLDELKEYEELIQDELGMDRLDPEARYPWMRVVKDIAEEQGFLHWELDFALAFTEGGGFDLQVGNPPWVQPQWREAPVLAEFEPWFMLTEKPPAAEKHQRRAGELARPEVIEYTLRELTATTTLSDHLAAPQIYPLLAGSQPDLYRAFMCKVWAHTSAFGSAGLIHPDSHFNGDKEGSLREESYRRLRLHGDFVNAGNRFFPPPVGRSSHFGVHIYGTRGSIDFQHLSWLFSVDSLRLSFMHDGSGDAPGVKYDGVWDERPHLHRIVRVNEETLTRWRRLSGNFDTPVERTWMLTPVSSAENSAIDSLSSYPVRLGLGWHQISRGFSQSEVTQLRYGLEKSEALIEYNTHSEGGSGYHVNSWEQAILQGPQIGVCNPLFKQPSHGSGALQGLDHEAISDSHVPESEFRSAVKVNYYRAEQEKWVDLSALNPWMDSGEMTQSLKKEIDALLRSAKSGASTEPLKTALGGRAVARYSDFFRLAWREWIAMDTERSLYSCVLPPGPTHLLTIYSAELGEGRQTVLAAGFWSSIAIDYMLRITGTKHLQPSPARRMPIPRADHPLAPALLLRTLRLNCLTNAYAGLWQELYDSKWAGYEPWARTWPLMTTKLHETTPTWQRDTPLRTEYARRSALVEIDALVSVWLGIDADTLVTMYRARFPIMQDFDRVTWFDAAERKIAGDRYTYGHGQTKETWKQFEAYKADPAFAAHQADPAANPAPETPVPDGYTAPFYKADRETEMREAHAYFKKRLDAAVAAGKWDPVAQEVPKS